MQVHKFALGLKETLRPLVCKEKCTTLNEAIELALVLEDGKKYPNQGGQKSSWTRMARPTTTPFANNQLANVSKPKETQHSYDQKFGRGQKEGLAEQAFNRSMLTPQQRDKAMKDGLCYGCQG